MVYSERPLYGLTRVLETGAPPNPALRSFGLKAVCHMVYISTDCADDLSAQASELVRFERPAAQKQCPPPPMLKHEHKWFVGSKFGCSCAFRHLPRESVELGFRKSEDWYPEAPEHLDATRLLYGTLNNLIQRGYRVDLLDCWSGDENKDVVALDVSLSQVSADHFRMFEGHLFNLTP